eukprot:COSAG02_NODE_6933_length_3282_cov_1.510839_2_plen_37_part_00
MPSDMLYINNFRFALSHIVFRHRTEMTRLIGKNSLL